MWRMRRGIGWIKEERKRKEETRRVAIAVVATCRGWGGEYQRSVRKGRGKRRGKSKAEGVALVGIARFAKCRGRGGE
jgi:hypothetical protein